MSNRIHLTRVAASRLSQQDFNNIPFGQTFSDHMFMAEYNGKSWENPMIIPFGNFSVHPACFALHYGQAIFEGMKASKTIHGEPMLFRPEMHAKRINASAERMCMPAFPEDLFVEAVQKLVGIDHGWIPPQEGSALYIRPFMFACDEFFGVRPGQRYKFIIYTGPVGPYYSKPVRLKAELEFVRAVKGGTGEAKCAGNYGGALLANERAKAAGYDQVMWMDGHEFRYVEEVGTMNIFFVIDGVAVTPSTDGTILKGITRDSIITILKDEGYKVEERKVDIHEIIAASKQGKLNEAFGVGTAAVVAPIAEIAYKDETLFLPPAESFELANFAKNQINGMRSGRIDDPRGWVVPVDILETADM